MSREPQVKAEPPDRIAIAETLTGDRWEHIHRARSATDDVAARLTAILRAEPLSVPADCAFVAFGSIARREWSAKSDIDWTLLVDGQADPQHLSAAQTISKRLTDNNFQKPGPTGVFGSLTFSHELLHRIGGEHDTNQNTTQRCLLLLEATDLGIAADVRRRVTSALIQRYVEDDRGYHGSMQGRSRVPRFLLNDIVRFWRTMAVDFAAKRRERAGRGWALRNFKLRCSRKLLFAAGLAACLDCKLSPDDALADAATGTEQDYFAELTRFLIAVLSPPPLDILAGFCIRYDARSAARTIFGAYDHFLRILNDADSRRHFETMDIDAAENDELFRESKHIANEFQNGLCQLFFETNANLRADAQRYGVF